MVAPSRRILVTGASRGVGLELVREYARRGAVVHATCRRPEAATELAALADEHPDGRVEVDRLDVTSEADLRDLVDRLAGRPLDVVVCNAATSTGGATHLRDLDWDAWREALEVNLLGAIRTALALAPNVAATDRGRIAVVSSKAGIVRGARGGMSYGYRSSKAALNAATRILAGDLEEQGIVVALVNPGHARTGIGGPGAPMSAAESAVGLVEVIDGLTPERSGRFWHVDGTEIRL